MNSVEAAACSQRLVLHIGAAFSIERQPGTDPKEGQGALIREGGKKVPDMIVAALISLTCEFHSHHEAQRAAARGVMLHQNVSTRSQHGPENLTS